VRKLKELGLTESLDIGYRISPRGAAVIDAESGVRRQRSAPDGTTLPRIGAPATRALRAQGVWTLEQVQQWREEDLIALHGVGPVAVRLLRDALAERGWTFAR
jgi:predicted flap endonuclease-1-like 5' DNA nuclease